MIIADTGFWIALFNRRDAYHNLARQCLPLLTLQGVRYAQRTLQLLKNLYNHPL